MKWEVTGADRQTGADRTLTLDADDEAQAKRRANRQGLLVADARPLDPDDSVAGAVPMAGATVPPRMPPVAVAIPYATPTVPDYRPPPSHHGQPPRYGRPVVVELTSKRLKEQMLLAVGVVVFGLFLGFVGECSGALPLAIIGFVIAAIGFAGLFWTKVQIWWEHG